MKTGVQAKCECSFQVKYCLKISSYKLDKENDTRGICKNRHDWKKEMKISPHLRHPATFRNPLSAAHRWNNTLQAATCWNGGWDEHKLPPTHTHTSSLRTRWGYKKCYDLGQVILLIIWRDRLVQYRKRKMKYIENRNSQSHTELKLIFYTNFNTFRMTRRGLHFFPKTSSSLMEDLLFCLPDSLIVIVWTFKFNPSFDLTIWSLWQEGIR